MPVLRRRRSCGCIGDRNNNQLKAEVVIAMATATATAGGGCRAAAAATAALSPSCRRRRRAADAAKWGKIPRPKVFHVTQKVDFRDHLAAKTARFLAP